MWIYVLEVHEHDFDFDEIMYSVVIADNDEQAFEIAKTQNDVRWVVEKKIKTIDAEPQLVTSYMHHG